MLRKKYDFSGHGRLQMSMLVIAKLFQKRQNFPARAFGARKTAMCFFWAMARQKSIRESVRLTQSEARFFFCKRFHSISPFLQVSLRICAASLSKNGARERNHLSAKLEYWIRNMKSTCTCTWPFTREYIKWRHAQWIKLTLVSTRWP